MEIFSTCKMTKRFPNGIRHQSTVWYDMKRYGLVRFDTVTSIFSQKEHKIIIDRESYRFGSDAGSFEIAVNLILDFT